MIPPIADSPGAMKDLSILAGLSLLFPIVIVWITASGGSAAGSLLRIVLAIPYLVFFPGYVLTSALFPGRDSLTTLERLGISLGLSISVVAFTGYGLNFTPWGIRLESLCVVITVLILLFCGLAFLQRGKLPPEKRFAVSIQVKKPVWNTADRTGTVLWALLFCAGIGTVVAIIYAVTANSPQERYTEFFIAEPDQEALASPDPVTLGGSITVVLGVVNHEFQ
ncbi:MAG: hypothetical protein A3K46_04860, partial [Chloroflexi bacterium RBG_13_60_9]